MGNDTVDKVASERQALLRQRMSIQSRLTVFKNHVDQIQRLSTFDDSVIIELEYRLNKIESAIDEFEEIQMKIENLADDSTQLEQRRIFSQAYFSAITSAKKILKNINGAGGEGNASTSASSESNCDLRLSGIKLPTIQLPKFNGSYEHWLEFRDSFQSLIHENMGINNIQKFHYLRASLVSSAIQTIQSLEFSANNYQVAWDILCKRYNNTRLLVHNHVKSLFSLEVMVKESALKIRTLIDNVLKHLRALNVLHQPTDQWDTLVIYIICNKLDKITAREWEQCKSENDLPTLDDLMKFLRSRADLLETLQQAGNLEKPGYENNGKLNTRAFFSTTEICVFCKGEHRAQDCSDFLKLVVGDRYDRVKAANLCFNCLKKRHFGKYCKSGSCQKCRGRHHTLLHYEREPSNSAISVAKPSAPEATYHVALSSTNILAKHQVILSTAYVKITDANGQAHHARALLDSGSQSSFITLALCKRLNLVMERANLSVACLNNAVSQIEHKCRVKMQSLQNAYSVNTLCYVLPEITGDLPNSRVDASAIAIPSNLKLADPTFDKPGKIDILIGADCFWNLICIGQISLGRNMPVLQKTRFGWVISGPIGSRQQTQLRCNFSQNVQIQDQLARFWEIEECSPITPMSAEENACEILFQKSTKRTSEGRFIVSIPWKESVKTLGQSKERACKRLYSLEKRFKLNSELRSEYVKFMEEYAAMGHMSEVATNDESELAYYMPHHGVIRSESLTTKLRVVFDGSAPTTSGVSINNLQMVGPVIQQDLFSIIVRFRKHMYVASADIAKMYRQVLIEPDQRKFQRIVWRSDPLQPIKTYNLNTVTYGTAAASFLAIRCLHELARGCQETSPIIAKIIREDFYVDDLLTGGESISALAKTCKEISAVLKDGCFDLRKWIANDQRVIQELDDTHLPVNVLDLGPHENTKTLGLTWSSQTDCLVYSIKLTHQTKTVTKRAILSAVAQIFDPLGLLSPCIVIAKILLQKLWKEKLSWDESLPANLHSQWLNFKDQLNSLNEIRIPRRVLCEHAISIEMHGFSDASEGAYGGCVYLRSVNKNGTVVVHLLCSKTKVAPLKTVTIPRLELCGALILARLVNKVQASLDTKFNSCTLWCDSTIVLSWLKTSPSILKPFVGNRIAEIQSLTAYDNWRHVQTNDNPADLLSRGVNPNLLEQSSIWWHGPKWLSKNESQWPTTILSVESLPEMRATIQTFQAVVVQSLVISNYSDLNKLQRIVAYCLRFKNNCLSAPEHRKYDAISASESQEALLCLIKIAQLESFPWEISNLRQDKALSTKSKLLCLNPYIDNKGILRVGGRLANSTFNNDKMHPMILDGRSHLMKLIFRQEHIRLLHPGPQLLLASIRERFWPTVGRNAAKGIVRECVRCFRVNPKISIPIMGNLPENRVIPTYPFTTTGVDYGGPFTIKDRKGRGCKMSKCYLCLFVCFSTKAVHLELVTDLTKDAFILALRRFVSRRGRPVNIYSDNGTNFVGANSELKSLAKFLAENEKELTASYAGEGLNWHFIPAHSPHFGGLWEAGIKSTKHHLKRIVGNALLTYEELATVLVQIEAVLNSRPLSPLTSDPNDPTPLTPAHFLVGKSLIALPDPDTRKIPENRLSIYQLLQQILQNFWSRWSKEYISQLQQRVKWRQQTSNIKEGSLVVIKEENLPPMKWLLGRVVQAHPGDDGVVRVVTIKTVNGQLKRAVAKVCVLPLDEKDTI